MTGSLGPTSTYATPSPRKSLSKFTDCLARPGQSRRSPHSAAHTALAANTACQASRSLHSAMHATHRGLRLSLLAPRRMHALACLGSYCPAAGRRAPARARAPARTSARPHELLAPWRLPSSPTSSFEPCTAARYQLPARRSGGAAGHRRALPVRCRRTVAPPPHPTPPRLP